METLLIAIFVVCYAAITLEHPLKVNKSAPALIGAGVLWAVYAVSTGQVTEALNESVAGIAQIIFFLMGAMTIVEVVDAHDGFDVITERIRTRSMTTLLWIISIVTFFLSAVLDNLTTTIVMLAVNRRLIADDGDRLFAAGMVVIAANAGGAWSPIGDVTTTMLWIGGQVTAVAIMKGLIVPSLINLAIPLAVVSYLNRGKMVTAPNADARDKAAATPFEKNLMFFAGVGMLCAVPLFKALTHLPPFMGVLFAVGLLWLLGELVHARKVGPDREELSIAAALQRIDLSSLLFFIGILLAVAVLEHSHILAALAKWLDTQVGNQALIVGIFGIVSAIVDNVPLVAASIGMYPLTQYPPDSFLWEFLAYATGTGGSILVIGSAAGVAAMGIEKIDFFWYVRKISPLALLGYVAGALCYVAMN